VNLNLTRTKVGHKHKNQEKLGFNTVNLRTDDTQAANSTLEIVIFWLVFLSCSRNPVFVFKQINFYRSVSRISQKLPVLFWRVTVNFA
jgi:hypothetical protein